MKKMKRILSMAVALLVASMTMVTAFAVTTYCEPSDVYGGEKVTIDTDQFFYDEKPLGDTLYKPDTKQEIKGYSVKASWKKNGSYVQEVYFKDGDDYVTVAIKPGINLSSDKEITGTITIRDIEGKRNYVCRIDAGDLVVKGIDGKVHMWEDSDKQFSLPDEYQTKKVRFMTEDGNKYGTFTADFDNDYGDRVATFVVKVVDQSPLYLGFNEGKNTDLMKKYPDADMRFINWNYPQFEMKGKLSIYMEPNEYIYGINTDGSLYRLGGSWDNANDAYVITTDTLGCYVVSDTQLVKTSGGTTTTPSSASSTVTYTPSSVAPPPSSVAPPPSSSSVTPPPPPSSTPEPSSTEPAPEPSSDPEPEESSSSESSRPASTKPSDDDDDKSKDKDKDKKGFPIIPVLLGVLVVVVVVCTVIVLGNQNSKQGRRKKRFDDDWDD